MPDDFVKIKKEHETDNSVCCSDGDHYPYGTGINLEDELLDELGVGSFAVGDVVELRGFAFVESKAEQSSKEHSNKNLRLQLTHLKMRRENTDIAQQLYGDGVV